MQALEHFEVYSTIWARAVDVELADFLARDPKVNEFEAVVREYELLEIDINAEPAIFDIGPIAIVTGAYSTVQCSIILDQPIYVYYRSDERYRSLVEFQCVRVSLVQTS